MDLAKTGSLEGDIESFSSMAKELASTDISRKELGSALGFHAAEEVKNKICNYVVNILERVQKHQDKLNAAALAQALKVIAIVLKQVSENVGHIEGIVKENIHNESFTSQRTNYIAEIQKQLVTARQQLHTLELDLKSCEVEELLGRENYLAEVKNDAEKHLNAAKIAANKIEKVLVNLQNKTVSQGLDESQSHFGGLKANHRRFEWAWFSAFAITSSVAVCCVLWVFCIEPPKTLSITFGIELLQRALLLSSAGVGMRLSLTKYNTERSLRIVYEHREKVLDQYRTFEAGIGDDSQAKNEFRLEIVKYIFSDPKSGYGVSSSVGTEINLNPVVGAVESLIRK